MPSRKSFGVSVIGLGKLGSPLAAVIAACGHQVVGVDLNPDFVAKINQGLAPVQETGLQKLLQKAAPRLKATSDFHAAMKDSNITFIIVPTPTDESGGFTNQYLLSAIQTIGAELKRLEHYHLVVVTSTVMPGSMSREIVPALERSSGLKCGRDFGVCYNPEFIALGSVIHDIMNPDLVLVGESDPRAGDFLSEFYETICLNSPPVARMNLINAELTKLTLNTFVTTKISFANLLGELCEQIPQADVDVVSQAVGLDRRVGQAFFRAGTRYGGPCLPRDNRALGVLANSVGVPPILAEATEMINRRQHTRLLEMIQARLNPGNTVAVLGLAYKTGTVSTEESQGVALAADLIHMGYQVKVYDPLALQAAKHDLGNGPYYAESIQDCVARADAVVLTLPDPAYQSLQPRDLAADRPRPVLVLDCWRILEAEPFKAQTDYVALGLGLPDFKADNTA